MSVIFPWNKNTYTAFLGLASGRIPVESISTAQELPKQETAF